MQLQFKDDRLTESFRRMHNILCRGFRPRRPLTPLNLASGFTLSMLMAATDIDLEFDLTYDTVKNLPAVLNQIFCTAVAQRDCDPPRYMAACIASYLAVLLVNEHGVAVDSRDLCSEADAASEQLRKDPRLWMGQTLMLGEEHFDFRPPAVSCIQYTEGDKDLAICLGKLLRAYQKLSGVDLKLYGIPEGILICHAESVI